jgi:hypothetical protein
LAPHLAQMDASDLNFACLTEPAGRALLFIAVNASDCSEYDHVQLCYRRLSRYLTLLRASQSRIEHRVELSFQMKEACQG